MKDEERKKDEKKKKEEEENKEKEDNISKEKNLENEYEEKSLKAVDVEDNLANMEVQDSGKHNVCYVWMYMKCIIAILYEIYISWILVCYTDVKCCARDSFS